MFDMTVTHSCIKVGHTVTYFYTRKGHSHKLEGDLNIRIILFKYQTCNTPSDNLLFFLNNKQHRSLV